MFAEKANRAVAKKLIDASRRSIPFFMDVPIMSVEHFGGG